MPATRTERITASDGSFDAHLALPEPGRGPGIVLCQEIFGVNDYIHAAANRLASRGFVVAAPDLFWRMEPHVALPHDEDGLNRAMGFAQRLDAGGAVEDCDATLQHLRSLPEVAGPTGVLGFCLGGTLAYLLAARSDPGFAVSYYGSGVPDALDAAAGITCPLLLHFGGNDPYIPRDAVERARAALEGRDDVEFHIHEGAGHAFDNHEAPMFHDPQAAEAAWRLTAGFLERRAAASA
ncbi:MAG: dienelactone hydrolase family protein [Actinomycetota bacterium]